MSRLRPILSVGGADRVVGSATTDATVTGTGEAGRIVTVKHGSTVLGTAACDVNGQWNYALTKGNLGILGQGAHSLTAVQVDAVGNMGTSADFSFTVQTQTLGTTLSHISFVDKPYVSTDAVSLDPLQDITATLSSPLAAGMQLMGSLDNGQTWSDVSAKVNGTQLVWDNVRLQGSGGVVLQLWNTAGNSSAAFSQAYDTQNLGHHSAATAPIDFCNDFYAGTGPLLLDGNVGTWWQSMYFFKGDLNKGSASVLNTPNGGIIGLGTLGESGRIATVNDMTLIRQGLMGDPASGGIARGIFNLFNWLANENRSGNAATPLHVLNMGSEIQTSLYGNQSISNAQGIYYESAITSVADYLKTGVSRFAEALKTDGTSVQAIRRGCAQRRCPGRRCCAGAGLGFAHRRGGVDSVQELHELLR